MKSSPLSNWPVPLIVLVTLAIASFLQAHATPAAGAATTKPQDSDGGFELRGVVHSEGKWLAAIADRSSGNRISWLEKNQVFAGFVVKEIGEQTALLVDQQTGRPITLYLQFAKVTKSVDEAVAVARVSSGPGTAGLSKASSLVARLQAGTQGKMVAPALVLPSRDGLPEDGRTKAVDAALSKGGANSADAEGVPPSESDGRTK